MRPQKIWRFWTFRQAKFSHRSRFFQEFESPDEQQGQQAARGVNQYVREMRRSRGHEHLMDFIAGGINKDDEQGDRGTPPRPRARLVFYRLVQRAPKQNRQQSIFGQMRAFADNQNNVLHARFGHLRKKPMQQRRNEARGMLIRMRIA